MHETTRYVDKPVDGSVEQPEASSPYLRLRLRSLAEVERDRAARSRDPQRDLPSLVSFPRRLVADV